MTRRQADKRCLALAGASTDMPFGPDTAVYRVGGKLFALMGAGDDATAISLKCDPGLAETLRADYKGVRPGYHLNKRHWNTVDLRGDVPDAVLRDLIEDSYDLVVSSLSKAVQRSLGWAPAVDLAGGGS